MATVVSIGSRCGLRIEVHCRNQSNKTKVVLYEPLISLKSHLKQWYISNKLKIECFSYKVWCKIHVSKKNWLGQWIPYKQKYWRTLYLAVCSEMLLAAFQIGGFQYCMERNPCL